MIVDGLVIEMTTANMILQHSTPVVVDNVVDDETDFECVVDTVEENNC